MTADSEEWLIRRVAEESDLLGLPLSDAALEMLRSDVRYLRPDDHMAMMILNNRVVEAARSAMERSKRSGDPTVTPRRGLRIPTEWNDAYSDAFKSNSSLVISAIMQNAMMANPMAGERRKWKSK
jgi:hypothetical protein